jgi:hypothetical protein
MSVIYCVRGVLMCFCGVSSVVVILELEFYSNGQDIALLRSSIGSGPAETNGEAMMQRRTADFG